MNAHPSTNVNRGGHAPGQIQFRVGQMLEFITTRPFTLGSTGIQVRNGTVILFDGTNAEVDGAKYTLPFLRGAVKAGWLVLVEEYDPENPAYAQRARANIQVREAKGGNPLDPKPRTIIATTESDEREVGNTRQHAERTAAANKSYVRGQTVNGVQPGQMVRTQRGMMVVEEQDGIELDRKLSTPAGERSKERIDLTTDKAAQAMRTAQTAMVRPGQGITEEEMLDRMSPEEQEEYLARKDAIRSQYVADSPAPTQALPRPATTRVVARVQSSRGGEHEGMSFRNSVGSTGSSVGDASDGEIVGRVHDEDAQEQVIEQEGITFRTSGLKKSPVKKVDQDEFVPQRAQVRVAVSAEPPPPVPANLDVRRQVAKMVCPEFPENYDFTLSPKKKLARLQADYEDRHDILRAVYAAESDDMKALLLQEFPQAFTQ